jgi:hydrogenase maturation protein HypF
MLQGLPASRISARFHHGVANMVLQVCTLVRDKYGSTEVALSGGVWQNVLLLSNTARLLKEAGFTVYTHHLVPPNDGGLALGQAILASRWLQKNENQWAR